MECKIIPFWTAEERDRTDTDKAEALLSQAMEGFHKKLVVLDDDPTGVQTVHDVSVYTDWEEESIRKGFEEKEAMFFILTNSRSFSVEETTKVHQDIAARVAKVARELGQDFMIISRGDSTLRGHYPLETQLLADGLTKNEGVVIDGEIICPFFPEGGRYTMDNIHYVKEQENLVPAGMTEFAKDKTFGYKSSDLTEYVEEKTEGKYHKEDCITISLDELNALDVQGIKDKLMSAQNMAKIIVNAVSYADLKVFCAALVLAMKAGKHYMARTAAAFTKVMGRISDQPLLGRAQLEGDTKNGGIVLIGSHVKKTTDQLNCLKKLDGQADFMEFQVNTVFEENGLEKEVERTVKAAEEKILSGRTVVIYTSRQLLAPENMTPEEKLHISVKISNAVTSIIGKLSVKPKFIIAKGGITSSDVGTKALRVKKARVMGQVKKGIPVWMTGEESKFPGMPYIIFPGNVGEVSTLKEIVEELI
ncbi:MULTISPECIES: four-carbon acid sugar kinase family protein [Clostridia]|uniref:four-carbon acid sugar kinase family protein n=2 Tax=Bacillota TaxID=1239 RepID=UPI0018986FDF|nr:MULTISPECIES: four-carbon acid sugar kinase family protein [Clostridia]MCB6580628.1 hydroxyacid dehydrogenase [Blautia faecis]MCB7292641.1 hydroxyacid dehydrogenase [Blautia faecis]MDB8780826.1 four-carbon acid sugar kinase family protein [Ruminococcus sp. 1001136sp1]MDB8788410.1 four-carbon acid sugar kinase family protein [Ruminococcus sp. 1001136sp1]MEE0743198.1 four-carbon acid sugar kinase family protein [Blautia faecis]